MDEVKDLQNLLGEDQVQVGKQMGKCYQQQAEGRLLVKTVELCHKIMLEKHERDVGPFCPPLRPSCSGALMGRRNAMTRTKDQNTKATPMWGEK